MRVNAGSLNIMNSLYSQQNKLNAGGSAGRGLGLNVQNKGTASSGWQQGSGSIDIDSSTSVRKQMQQQLRELFEKQQNKNNILPLQKGKEKILHGMATVPGASFSRNT